MTTNHTPEGTNNFNTTGLDDTTFRKMIDAGYTVEAIERFYNQLEYRKMYNARPDVKAKRALYNRVRAEQMKGLRSLLK